MNSVQWDIYTITSDSENWSICAKAVCVRSVCHLSLSFSDLSVNRTVSVEKKKRNFRLEKDFEQDSSAEFSSEDLLLCFVKTDGKRHLVLNAPHMVLPDGRKGVTVNVQLKGSKAKTFEHNYKKCRICGMIQDTMTLSGDIRLGDDFVSTRRGTIHAKLELGRGNPARGCVKDSDFQDVFKDIFTEPETGS